MANGKAGPPKGNNNAVKNRPWAEAIRMEISTRKEFRKLAAKLVDMALEGDMSALKEIGDRIDGKAQQVVEYSGEIDHTIRTAEEIPFTGIREKVDKSREKVH